MDDLDLLAFRFVAGEMTPEEARAFEARLADDQEAREAISRCVGLTGRLVEAGPPVESAAAVLSFAARWRNPLLRAVRPLGWMTAGAAATLLTVYVAGTPNGKTPQGQSRPQETRPEPAADAVIWAQLRASQDWTTPELEDWVNQPDTLGDAEPVALEEATTLPSWVFSVTPRTGKRGKP